MQTNNASWVMKETKVNNINCIYYLKEEEKHIS
jgi:hypothetical protein